jgi:uncharacterized phage protein gp47/JayE
MSFRVRTLTEILDGMMATVLANSNLSDVNRGSITRAILEAGSLQDADQYVQIARLRNLFNLDLATGTDLDGRGADYNNPRLQPTQSAGLVKFGDSAVTAIVSSTLSAGVSAGATSLSLVSSASFPSTGAIVIDRDVPGKRETIPYTANVANVLTLASSTTATHLIGATVLLSTAGSDRTFSSGTTVSVPATGNTTQIDFTTQAGATLKDGDMYSAPVTVISVLTGAATIVGGGQISVITGAPFSTATVTNDAVTMGGQDLELDDAYRQRIKQTIAALSNGTLNDLYVATSQVALASGQRVVSVQVVENFTDPDVTVYIDDGTGAVATTADVTARELLIFPANSAGQRRAHLQNWPVVSGTLHLSSSTYAGVSSLVTPGSGNAVLTVTPYVAPADHALAGQTLIDPNYNLFTITDNVGGAITVTVVGGLNPLAGAYAVLSSSFLTLGTDYLFNETTGDIELTSPLGQGFALFATPSGGVAYTYYTGLIQEVQRVLNGDPSNLTVYPGVKATGVKLKVQAPAALNVSLTLAVYTSSGVSEAALLSSVQTAVQTYVNGLSVGDDVILAKIVEVTMQVPGVADCRILSPTSNIIVADGYLPRTRTSLITLS